MKTHRELHPEQYKHFLVGRFVTVVVGGRILTTGVVERVVDSRFGRLAILPDQKGKAFAVRDCHEGTS